MIKVFIEITQTPARMLLYSPCNRADMCRNVGMANLNLLVRNDEKMCPEGMFTIERKSNYIVRKACEN